MAGKTDPLVGRHEYILRQLQETGSVTIDELCKALGIGVTRV
jgi:DeoR/GlpR family transcriptional regulator of sugar metabolism